jgi:hypothetical protein
MTDVSEEHVASIYMLEEINQHEAGSKQTWLTLVSFEPEDCSDVLLRNGGWYWTLYMALYLRI